MKFYYSFPLPEDHLDLTDLCSQAEEALGSIHTNPQLEYEHPITLFHEKRSTKRGFTRWVETLINDVPRVMRAVVWACKLRPTK